MHHGGGHEEGARGQFTAREGLDERAVRLGRAVGRERYEMGANQVPAEPRPDPQDNETLGRVAQVHVESAGLDAHGTHRAHGRLTHPGEPRRAERRGDEPGDGVLASSDELLGHPGGDAAYRSPQHSTAAGTYPTSWA
ncbi:hypothetical protein ABZ825_21835 [Streptomyces tauricus]|uniref:hypothetical protein n=1 Tax=Streptomyces tauricus TaxID=68274 RepID=UPI0033E896D8